MTDTQKYGVGATPILRRPEKNFSTDIVKVKARMHTRRTFFREEYPPQQPHRKVEWGEVTPERRATGSGQVPEGACRNSPLVSASGVGSRHIDARSVAIPRRGCQRRHVRNWIDARLLEWLNSTD